MAFLLKRKKTPKQLADALVEAMRGVNTLIIRPLEPNELPPRAGESDLSAADREGLEKVGLRLKEVRTMMCGDSDNPPKKEDPIVLAQSLREQGVPLTLIQNLGLLPFSVRNDAAFLLSHMIQMDLGGFATKYLRQRSRSVMRLLVELFSDPGIALHCGSLLRECLRYDFMCCEFLENTCWIYDRFYDQYLCAESFDISSDAFSTFRDSLKKQPTLVPAFLIENYDHFFEKYNKLLVSDAYVTQRQSLKLLGELLLDRLNYKVMIRYIGDKDNLKIIMNLMRVKSPAIQMEAFHVFKVFVANPKKTDPIATILGRNREKIIKYLDTLSADKEDDEQFIDERKLLIDTLRDLQIPEEIPSAEGVDLVAAPEAASQVQSLVQPEATSQVQSEVQSEIISEAMSPPQPPAAEDTSANK